MDGDVPVWAKAAAAALFAIAPEVFTRSRAVRAGRPIARAWCRLGLAVAAWRARGVRIELRRRD